MTKKTLRNDLILIGSLLLVAILAVVLVFTSRKEAGKATITVKNQVVEVIDLSKKLEKDYYIEGSKGTLHVHTKDGAIAVLESNCPHQDCVNIGYVSDSNHPIICAYNEVVIVVGGESSTDVVVG